MSYEKFKRIENLNAEKLFVSYLRVMREDIDIKYFLTEYGQSLGSFIREFWLTQNKFLMTEDLERMRKKAKKKNLETSINLLKCLYLNIPPIFQDNNGVDLEEFLASFEL